MVNTLPRTLFDTLMTTKFQLQNYTKLSSFHCITYCRTSSYLYSIPKVLTYRIQRGLYCHVQQLYIRNNYQTTRNVTEPMLKTTYHSYLTPDPPFIPQNPSLKRDLIREPPTPITTTNTHNLDPAPKEKQQHINQTRPEIPNAPLKPAISPKPSSPGSPNLEICCTSASRQELSSDECAAFAGSWGVSNWFFFFSIHRPPRRIWSFRVRRCRPGAPIPAWEAGTGSAFMESFLLGMGGAGEGMGMGMVHCVVGLGAGCEFQSYGECWWTR